jgi:hypothetical protein
MPTITITVTDTPSGGISVHSSFAPAIGQPCSLAQSAALEMITRTRKHYGLPNVATDAAGKAAHPCSQTRTTQCGDCGTGSPCDRREF